MKDKEEIRSMHFGVTVRVFSINQVPLSFLSRNMIRLVLDSTVVPKSRVTVCEQAYSAKSAVKIGKAESEKGLEQSRLSLIALTLSNSSLRVFSSSFEIEGHTLLTSLISIASKALL